MLERILEKLGVSTAEEFIENEEKFLKENKGYEVERRNPFLVLNEEEMDYFFNYVTKNVLA